MVNWVQEACSERLWSHPTPSPTFPAALAENLAVSHL